MSHCSWKRVIFTVVTYYSNVFLISVTIESLIFLFLLAFLCYKWCALYLYKNKRKHSLFTLRSAVTFMRLKGFLMKYFSMIQSAKILDRIDWKISKNRKYRGSTKADGTKFISKEKQTEIIACVVSNSPAIYGRIAGECDAARTIVKKYLKRT